jgi:N-acetylneuraminic acid mutarotase
LYAAGAVVGDRSSAKRLAWSCSVGAALAALGLVLPGDARAAPGWSPAAAMGAERTFLAAAPLPDGKVLAVGGESSPTVRLASVEIYDPVSGSWSAAADMHAERIATVAAPLPDGRVLVAGGIGDTPPLSSAEIYDPAANVWQLAADLPSPRMAAAAAPLPDGRVLVAGGEGAFGPPFDSAVIYDPATDSWSDAADMPVAVAQAAAAPLASGRVMVAGGNQEVNPPMTVAQVYDPTTDSWDLAADMNVGRTAVAAAPLPGGRVLVAGGTTGPSEQTATAEVYDPASDTWTLVQSLPGAHQGDGAAALGGGRVLVAGGFVADASETAVYTPPTSVSVPASAGFGSQAVAQPGPSLFVPVVVTGDAPLWVTGTTVTGPNAGDFRIPAGGDGCSGNAPIPVAGVCWIELRFIPGALGARSATLTISSNAGDRSVALDGTGVSPAVGPAGPPGPTGPPGRTSDGDRLPGRIGVRIVARRAPLGRVRLRLVCAQTPRCRGRVRLTRQSRRAPHRGRIVLAGHRRYDVRRGRHLLTIRLDKRARRLLRRRGELRVTATASLRGSARAARSTRTLRRPRHGPMSSVRAGGL